MKVGKIYFCGLVAIVSLEVRALNLGCVKSQVKNLRAVTKIAVDGPDERRTVSQYASEMGKSESEIERSTSGTGVISCGKYGDGTGNLVGNQSVLVTSGHLFYDDECKPKNPPLCSLFMRENGRFTELQIDLSSLRTGGCPTATKENDWAVLRLTKPAPKRFTSYKLPSTNLELSSVSLVQVAARASNFSPEGPNTKNLVNCNAISTAEAVAANGSRRLVTNCDSGKGSSGSAVFLRSDLGGVLAAVHGGIDRASGKNRAVILEGDFLEAVKSAIGNNR